jgi:L-cysteine/cystine lyase
MIARERLDLEEGRSSRAYFHDVRALRERLRDALARVIGAPGDSVALTSSTTDGCNIAVASLGLEPEDEIVTTDAEHPGLAGAIRVSGARVQTARVSERPAADALELLEAEIGPRTRLIAISHVVWTTGQVLPVAELAGRGIPVLVDGAQAAGAIPVDVETLGCDFYTVSGQKWLLGPDATGGLYVRPDLVEELRVALPSFLSWEYPEFTPKRGALRFEPGWIPTASIEGLLASLEFAERAGEERFARARAAAERCRDAVGVQAELVTEPGQATLVSWKAEGDAEAVARRLEEAGVIVRDLPATGWLRASCGFWTSDDDLDRLVRAL